MLEDEEKGEEKRGGSSGGQLLRHCANPRYRSGDEGVLRVSRRKDGCKEHLVLPR